MILIPQYRTARRASAVSLDLLSNLILSLDLEEASGNAIDSSGNGYDFADTNTVGQTTGATAGYNSRQFTAASSEYFTRAHSTTELTIGDNEWAAHLWVYANSATAGAVVFGKSGNSNTPGTTIGRSYNLNWQATSTLAFYAGPASGATHSQAAAASNSAPDATWVPTLIWHDPTANVIGIKVGSGSAVTAALSGGVRDGTSGVTLATRGSSGAYYFNGNIAALRMWRGSGVIAQIVDNTDALDFLNAQQRRHSELT